MSIVGERVFSKGTGVWNSLISYLVVEQHFHKYRGRLSIPLQEGSGIVGRCSSAVGNYRKVVCK